MLSSWTAITERLKEYYGHFLLLQIGMLGVFMARDFLLFFVFWELTLVPMYFIIAIWGGAAARLRRHQVHDLHADRLRADAARHSGPLLPALSAVPAADVRHGRRCCETKLPTEWQWWVFWAFFLGFAVKVPMWPFHTWLPDAHTEAPTAGSVILASILLKMGTYGFLRFSLPMLPDAAQEPDRS